MKRPPPRSTLFPYPTLFRSYFEQTGHSPYGRASDPAHNAISRRCGIAFVCVHGRHRHKNLRVSEEQIRETATELARRAVIIRRDRKSTRLNSSHSQISYAVF